MLLVWSDSPGAMSGEDSARRPLSIALRLPDDPADHDGVPATARTRPNVLQLQLVGDLAQRRTARPELPGLRDHRLFVGDLHERSALSPILVRGSAARVAALPLLLRRSRRRQRRRLEPRASRPPRHRLL